MTFYDVYWADGSTTRVIYAGPYPRGADRWREVRTKAKEQEKRTDQPIKIIHSMSSKTVWRKAA